MRQRDNNLDVIRGLALATITVNHFSALVGELGYRGAQFPTFTHFGYSSAAEIFFLMSGYLLGVLYLQPAADGAIGRFAFIATARALKLYFYNLVLFISCSAWCRPQAPTRSLRPPTTPITSPARSGSRRC